MQKKGHSQSIKLVAAVHCHDLAYKDKRENSKRKDQSTRACHLANVYHTQDPAILDWPGFFTTRTLKASYKQMD